jgi:sugar lactone lactonase YvrE
MTWAPDGTLWLIDPQNNRISMIDTAGTYVGSHQTIGGYMIVPWPGGFDDEGYFYTYAPDPAMAGISLVRYDQNMEPVDTVRPPRYPGEGVFFELRRGESFMRAGVPFRDRLEWRLTPNGDIWAMLTGEYRLFRVSRAGDTVRTVTREFEPIPVTGADIDRAIEEDLRWFRQQGGKIERSKFPDTKPATMDFFVDDEEHLWVILVTPDGDLEDRLLDVFDPVGRYLGQVQLAFAISRFPRPVFRDGMLFSVTHDDLEVPYVVRARIERL